MEIPSKIQIQIQTSTIKDTPAIGLNARIYAWVQFTQINVSCFCLSFVSIFIRWMYHNPQQLTMSATKNRIVNFQSLNVEFVCKRGVPRPNKIKTDRDRAQVKIPTIREWKLVEKFKVKMNSIRWYRKTAFCGLMIAFQAFDTIQQFGTMSSVMQFFFILEKQKTVSQNQFVFGALHTKLS